jgi:polyhydroxyalkanoate synthesis repressor PhaR
VADDQGQGPDPIIIKKYANRRLYNTQSSSYITLDDLSRMTREGIDFQVLDAKTGADITHQILTQIIMEEESQGAQQMLPISFLRQLISMYGNSMQALMPHYLEATMDNFRANQRKIQETWTSNMGPDAFAKMAENNMKMFQAAASAFIPGAKPVEPPPSKPAASGDLDALREQMAEMQRKLDELRK